MPRFVVAAMHQCLPDNEAVGFFLKHDADLAQRWCDAFNGINGAPQIVSKEEFLRWRSGRGSIAASDFKFVFHDKRYVKSSMLYIELVVIDESILICNDEIICNIYTDRQREAGEFALPRSPVISGKAITEKMMQAAWRRSLKRKVAEARASSQLCVQIDDSSAVDI